MGKICIFLIKIYQNIPGPWHGLCKHYPSCSNYALEAFSRYGFFKGFYLAFKRILRCNPLGKGGYDPVPGINK